MNDDDQRDELLLVFDHLGTIERKILLLIAKRLGMGQATYGRFAEVDKRTLAKETWEEVADALVYASKKLQELR